MDENQTQLRGNTQAFNSINRCGANNSFKQTHLQLKYIYF